MQINKLFLIAFVGAALCGCSGSSSEMSKQEVDALKNPPKTIPKEAIEGMKRQGELAKAQMDANAKAGVDARGIPIGKATDSAPVPGTATTPKTGG
ncbi:hypothetical protein [Fimbriimonas ginsengisoli]|uniref:Lipoprotein n=1 Tax=Fimbriimonas ginsengisoli Gsoil 348 TaxID=661478 RepID=A0A068NKJ5_FIMGI|nr:hypothetical protein [Fimbriimonas ginsengisoli]AIE84063.1 hypothetical protein OP10G_0695 [Fimbriimonas ginsengisoli Gsoil 348]